MNCGSNLYHKGRNARLHLTWCMCLCLLSTWGCQKAQQWAIHQLELIIWCHSAVSYFKGFCVLDVNIKYVSQNSLGHAVIPNISKISVTENNKSWFLAKCYVPMLVNKGLLDIFIRDPGWQSTCRPNIFILHQAHGNVVTHTHVLKGFWGGSTCQSPSCVACHMDHVAIPDWKREGKYCPIKGQDGRKLQ